MDTELKARVFNDGRPLSFDRAKESGLKVPTPLGGVEDLASLTKLLCRSGKKGVPPVGLGRSVDLVRSTRPDGPTRSDGRKWSRSAVGESGSSRPFVREAILINSGSCAAEETTKIASSGIKREPAVQGRDSIFARRSLYRAILRARLHQQAFRIMVLDAYGDNCTICHIKHTELLDAAHIIADGKPHGEPVVPNGLSLCKIHHAAFDPKDIVRRTLRTDSNLLGINPDYIIEVRSDVLKEHDGPMLKHGLSEGSRPHLDADGQELHGQKIILPKHKSDWPDRERLEVRWGEFGKAG